MQKSINAQRVPTREFGLGKGDGRQILFNGLLSSTNAPTALFGSRSTFVYGGLVIKRTGIFSQGINRFLLVLSYTAINSTLWRTLIRQLVTRKE